MRTNLAGTSGSRTSVLVLSALAAALVLLAFAGLARAATFTVTKRADTADGACTPQDCSLREAVIAANESDDADIIKVPQGTYTLTIPEGDESDLLGGDPTVGDLDILDDLEDESSNEVEIRGAGARSTIIQGGEEFDDRIFDIPGDITLTDPPEVLPSDAVVEIEGVRISGGNVDSIGGGIRNVGTLTLRESTLSNNTASIGGGGIRNDFDFTLIRSTVSNNTVTSSGEGPDGIGGGGGVFNNDTATLINSTISNNTAGTFGGGLTNFDTSGGSLTVSSVTLNANEAPNGANAANGTGDGGPSTQGEDTTAATFENTIVSNARDGQNCAGAFTSGGNNIDDDGSCEFLRPSDIHRDPRLGGLNNNGGPTNTHALRDRSPAIDEAEDTEVPTDQRGVRRPQDGDGRDKAVSDIGAFELESPDGGGGDDGPCTITGTRRDDVLRGTGRDDVICGLGGSDVIVGFGGDDLLQGDAGDDVIDAGPGADRVFGGNGDDAIDVSDGTGRDLADGESGTDACTVDAGDTVRSCRAT